MIFKKIVSLTYGLTILLNFVSADQYLNRCYNNNNKPVYCTPDFINIAHNQQFVVTNTCGELRSEFCVQTDNYDSTDEGDDRFSKCDVCDNKRRDKSHPPEYLTDYNIESNLTWWQSETMESNIQYPNTVNLTLHLGKSFYVTYIKIKFHSSRPESFAIYKREKESGEWQPFQYFSSNCELMYDTVAQETITKNNEAKALCTDEYSDIAPLSGGSAVFSTLEGRPSAFNFENSDILKKWVTATDLRITLNRLNTFGDEVFGDPRVLRSYYYAISDISVGGKCNCNGHASVCTIDALGSNFEEQFVCHCEHNTDGIDCEKCKPFFNDRPWAPATLTDANECLPCDCNGLSDKCIFNQTLFELTGHGGHCTDCGSNTDGPHCEYCKHGFYRREYDNQCIDCECHVDGSYSVQCDPTGKCKCKPGVTGDKCDRCMPNYYELSKEGCKMCSCKAEGSLDSPAICDPRDGKCRCKQNVEGHNCDRCKPGFFNLDGSSKLGCLPCFCYGHSSDCTASDNYYKTVVESSVELNNLQEWTATDINEKSVYIGLEESSTNGIFIFNQDRDVWFVAPEKFLGDIRTSYNQLVNVSLKFTQSKSSLSRKDFIIENANLGLQIYRSIYDTNTFENLDYFGQIEHDFAFNLNERDNWRPVLSVKDFQRLLGNVTSIKIKVSIGGFTYLKSFKLTTARKIPNPTHIPNIETASWIEQCNCPVGHTGQFCENCQVGYRRDVLNGDSFVRCVPCSCNNHSIGCDPLNGKCKCIHHTTGENCELCEEGFYGDALNGSPSDCKKCPCPNDGPCAEITNYQSNTNDVVCLKCPRGVKGNLCDICEDGFHLVDANSEKTGNIDCEKCDCNGNIDENAVGNCDPISGKCLRCVYNTTGDRCEKCQDSFWGNALNDVKCHPCECSPAGSNNPDQCNLDDGQCDCKKNVIGRQCDECKMGYWNINSGQGCEECKCNPLGSLNFTCDQQTSQCYCRPGVEGLKCDQCLPNYFGFSAIGCQKCDCDPFGSESQQCDEFGKCRCKPNIAGDKCNKCAENFFNFTLGCTPCDDCFNLVEIEVNNFRKNISKLENSLETIIERTMTDEARLKSKEVLDQLASFKTQIDEFHASLFEKQNLKSTYSLSIKHLNQTVYNISSEFKKLQRPLDLFEIKLESSPEQKLLKILGDIELQLTMNFIRQEQKRTEIESIKKQANEKSSGDSDDDESHKLQLKFSELARTARETSESQLDFSKTFQSKSNAYLTDSKKAIEDLNTLINDHPPSINSKKINHLDYGSIFNQTERLIAESNTLKSQLDSSLKFVQAETDKLKNVKISEQDLNAEIDKSYLKFIELNKNTLKAKMESENLFNETNKLNQTSESAIINAEAVLSIAKVKFGDYSQLMDKSKIIVDRSNIADKMAQEAFGNASNIVDTLENFDVKRSDAKTRVENALNLRNTTGENLNTIQDIYKKSIESIEKNKADFNFINNNLNLLKTQINNSNQVVFDFNEHSRNLKTKSAKLDEESNELLDEYEDLQESVDSMILKNQQHPNDLNKLQNKSENLLKKSHELFSNVNLAIDDVNRLEPVILSSNEIDSKVIESLKQRFEIVSKELDAQLNIDDFIKDLEERISNRKVELQRYEIEIPKLRQNIDQLSNIYKSMVCKT